MTKTVLVVDDEAPIRSLLSRWLEGWGYTVRLAATAREALEIMMAVPVDITLIDIGLPGHDGFWLVDRVREHWPAAAIIMATGADETDTVVRSQRAGVVDYVLKPFGRELLRQALDRAEAALS
jgi:DNA-binding response OmpR family regulator